MTVYPIDLSRNVLFSAFIASIASFIFGGIYFSPLFVGKLYQRLLKVNLNELKQRSMLAPALSTFLSQFVQVVIFHWVISNLVFGEPSTSLVSKTLPELLTVFHVLLLLWLALVVGFATPDYAWADRPVGLLAIQIGYSLGVLVIETTVFYLVKGQL